MRNKLTAIMDVLSSHPDIIMIAFFGGLVLFGVKVSQHFMRSEQDKLSLGRYIGFLISLLLALPFLGAGVTCIYILNGDKISTLLAFQIGLTSPAIVQKLVSAAANNMAQHTTPVVTPQQ